MPVGPWGHVTVVGKQFRGRMIRAILGHRVCHRHPTLVCHGTTIWDYGFRDLDAIELGEAVVIGPFVEILVYKRTNRSSVEGRLIMGDRSVISTGAHVRAAGGTIRIGAGTNIAQYSVLIAANHQVWRGAEYFMVPWDQTRTGIDIGRNVWVAAGCVILPGVTIGDNAVIAAGSVVSKNVPPDEIWGGVPARKIKDVPEPPP